MIQQRLFWEHIQKIWMQDLKRYLQSHIHSSTIHNSQKTGATHTSIRAQYSQSIPVVEYYSVMQRNSFLTQTTTWMPGGHCANETSQSRKDKHCVAPQRWGTWSSNIHWNREEEGGGQDGRRLLFNVYFFINGYIFYNSKIHFCKMKRVLETN